MERTRTAPSPSAAPAEAPTTRGAAPGRVLAIDQFRGLAIILMVAANFLSGVSGVPPWLKHAPDVGLTVTDLVAPFFIFAIGLTYGLSARRRVARQGTAAMRAHFLRRYLAVMGIGASIIGAQDFWQFRPGEGWGVLPAIGMAGLITLPVVSASPRTKVAVGLGLLLAYQVALDRYLVDRVLAAPHGGLGGSLGWGAMLILAGALADLYHGARGRRTAYVGATLLAGLAGLALSFAVPISKNRVSASYVLVSVAARGALFYLFHLLGGRLQAAVRPALRLLEAWGQNPLLLYVLHLLLLGIFVLPSDVGWYALATPAQAAAQLAGLLFLISLVAIWLDRRGWVLSL